jgi:hypothetical protein
MAITQITNFVIFGSSSDTKPLAGTPSQSLFFEIDTGRTYKFTGGAWSLFSGDIKTETLVNKTITTPIIAAIKVGGGGANTLTLPTITDTVVARTTTDTLTNKTLIAPVMTTIYNAGVITLPSGIRTLVARDTADTLLNKTVNVNSNTLTATSQATGDLLVNNGTQFIRLARGSNGQVLTSTSSTLGWSTFDAINNVIANIGIYSYTIFKSGSTYYYRNNLTGAVVSNSNPDSIFQAALTAGGNVFVQPATYTFSGSFTGLDFPPAPTHVKFIMDAAAILVVPNGYTGYVFRLINGSGSNACYNNTLDGGTIQEAGTIARNWTGIKLQATGTSVNGLYHNTIQNVQINFPNIGIHLNVDSTATNAWINSNYIKSNLIFGAKTAFVDFDQQASYSGSNGMHRNRFEYNLLQATNGTDATTGFRNIRHKDNQFIGNYVVDFSGSQITSNIHTDAQNTTIDGGTLTSLNFADSSTTQTTKIRDETYGTKISKITPGNAGTNLDIIPTGTTNTWSWYDSGLTKRFVLQKKSDDTVHLTTIKQTSGGVIMPVIFDTQDVPGSTITEVCRIDTDGTLKVKPSKLVLRNSSDSFSMTIAPQAITADRILQIPAITGTDVVVTQGFTMSVSNKTINLSGNTVNDTSIATGDLAKSNGTKFVRFAMGTGLQVLRTNTGATDLEWASLNSENTGTAQASGTGSATLFNIPHSLGTTPYSCFVQCYSHSTAFTYTFDSTNIAVTFVSAPPSGTNNVKFTWRAVA